MTVVTLQTADDLLRLPDDGWRYELVRGELRKMSPSGARHGRVAAEIVGSLIAHMKRNRTGAVYSSETGFRISRQPDTVRAPTRHLFAPSASRTPLVSSKDRRT